MVLSESLDDSHDIIKSKDTLDLYGIKNYFMSNVCAIYDFKYFKQNNGFTENIILNEDTYFAYKIINDGYKVLYNSNALVYHSHNYSYIKQFKPKYSIRISGKNFGFENGIKSVPLYAAFLVK